MKRVNGAMNVRAFWPEAGMKMGKGRNAKLERAVERMTKFAGVQDIHWSPDWLKETL